MSDNLTPEETAPEAVEAPKKRTTRRTTKKAAEAAPEATAQEAPAEAEPVKKPRRRTVKKAAEAPAAETPATEAPAEEAPKRRGRPRKAAAEPATAPAAEAPATEAPAEEAPKRRGRPRKTAAKENPTAEAAPEAAPEVAPEAASAVVEPAAQPETAADSTDVAPAPTAAEAEAEEQPLPKRRPRARAHTVETKSPEAAADAQAQGESQPAADSSDGKRQQFQKQNKQNKQQGKQNNKQQQNGKQRRQRRNNAQPTGPSVSLEELNELKVAELREKAELLGVDFAGLKKASLVEAVFEATKKAEGILEVEGILDILQDGYGFLRTGGYLPGENDIYVGTALIRRNGLRKGDYVKGQTRPARDNDKYAALQTIHSVNGKSLDDLAGRPRFGDLTPVFPDEILKMEHGRNTTTARVIDLVSPIGKGQRGLIVSPPKAGKTTILKDIAAAISVNNPEVHLMCLLVDERPEEVTDMQRSIKGEVIASTFDMPTENHIVVSELVIERAKRLVEDGQDVVILLDSLTRLARAYNLAQPASGRILSGGVDSAALYPPKKFLGAARNIEGGGSLTILASALIETGSKMDEVIFEEFKGTGNMELKLDRNLADRRIFPAIDPVQSGTRKEDLLLNPQEAPLIWAVRRILANMNNTERATDMLIKSLRQTKDNQEFLIRTAKKAQTTRNMDNMEL
ncbi:transcription termination factor Rho [Slackia heliotrinireducens]|uniref:transcription termination factor Rho n=1 Tax=Slackia heliotrinireducens TaxID=84110 RepID=UPI00331611AE